MLHFIPDPFRRRWQVLLLVAILLVFNLGLFVLRQEHEELVPERAAKPPPEHGRVDQIPIERKKNKQIETLRQETLEESLNRLSWPEMYFWPGTSREGENWHFRQFPMPPAVGQYDVRTIMSNRRFLKVYQELSVLPKKEAAALVKKHLRQARDETPCGLSIWGPMPSYKVYFDAILEKLPEHLKKSQSAYFSIPIQISDSEEPTFHGLRLKMLCLVLIAGNLELTDAFADVAGIVKEAQAQYQRVSRKNLFDIFMAFDVAQRHSLYNRQILATGLMGTSRDSKAVKALEKRLKWTKVDLTRYDAQHTHYDMYSIRGFVPVDLSGGVLMVRFLGGWTRRERGGMSDNEFQEIVRSLVPEKELPGKK
jgi:hypothetical protein